MPNRTAIAAFAFGAACSVALTSQAIAQISPRAALPAAPEVRPIIVAGGSISGLATALQLAKTGREVVVLEARADPRSLVEPAAGDKAAWGSRGRTIVMDHHSMEFLRDLGVKTKGFPEMKYLDLRTSDAEALSLSAAFSGRAGKSGNGRLDASTLILQRDFTHQPLISEMEKALLAAAESNPRISIVFDAQVADGIESAREVEVRYGPGGGKSLFGSALIVADGGGNRSVTRTLGIKRKERSRESLSTAVLDIDPEGRLLERPANMAGTAGHLIPGGWVGFNTDGRGRLAINVRGLAGRTPKSALKFAQDNGIAGTLVGMPETFEYPVDSAVKFASGSRIFLVGDAAVRGSPMFGLGGQYALLWAQAMSDLFERVPNRGGSPAAAARRRFEEQARAIVQARLAFETSLIGLIERGGGALKDVVSILTSPALSRAVERFSVDYVKVGARSAELKLDAVLNARSLIARGTDPSLARLFRETGRVMLTADAPVDLIDGDAELRLDLKHRVRLRTGLENIDLAGGVVSLSQAQGSWSMIWRDVRLKRDVTVSKSASEMKVDLRADLPGALLNRALEGAPAFLTALGAGAKPIVVDAELAQGQMRLGPMTLGLHGSPRLRATIAPLRQGGARVDLDFLEGYMTLDNAAELNLRVAPSDSLAELGRICQSIPLWGPFFASPIINAVARSVQVRQARFTLLPNGGVLAVYGDEMEFRLSKKDVGRLLTSVDSEELGGLMKECQRIVLSLWARI